MRPDTIKEYGWPVSGEWVRHQAHGRPKYAADMKGTCAECPLACYAHPMVPDPEEEHSFHKLCTLSVIASDPEKLEAVLAVFGKKREKKAKAVPPASEQLSIFDLEEQNLQETSSLQKLINMYQDAGLKPDEAKILAAGFILVRYIREEKTVYERLPGDKWHLGWLKLMGSPFATFTQAERQLAAILKDPQVIQVRPETGEVITGTGRCYDKLVLAGFDLYRSEGIVAGHGRPRIKCYTKGWGNWKKFETGKECQKAWDELMLTDKALQG